MLRNLSEEDFLDFKKKLEEISHGFVRVIRQLAMKGLAMIEQAKLPVKANSAAAFLKKFSESADFQVSDFKFYKKFEENIWVAKTDKKDIINGFEQVLASGLQDIRQKILDFHRFMYPTALTAQLILKKIYLLPLTAAIEKQLEIYKKKFNIVPIFEFNTKVNDIIRQSTVPFIYLMLGEKYHHYLLDEFQDTSQLQWQNLFPLIENALAYDYFNLAVGDSKQSIYRWRGGDTGVMEYQIPQSIHPQQFKSLVLDKNYRSCASIVQFNNQFFSAIRQDSPDILSIHHIYRDVAQHPVNSSAGWVSLSMIEESTMPAYCEQVMPKVSQIINDCLKKKYQLSDMAILVRYNDEAAKISDYLLNCGIAVVSPDSFYLHQIPGIGFLINVLRVLIDPSDRISALAINSYWRIYEADAFIDVSNPDPFMITDDQWDNLPLPLKTLLAKRDLLIRLPVYELAETIIRQLNFSLDFHFKNSLYLNSFLDVLLKFSLKDSVDVYSFLSWWEDNLELSIQIPNEQNAVKILTVHKAKGLEFPIVLIPFADWKYKKVHSDIWLSAEPGKLSHPLLKTPLLVTDQQQLSASLFAKAYQEEESLNQLDNINLLYVALTRAIWGLVIFSGTSQKNGTLLKDYGLPLLTKNTVDIERYDLGELPVNIHPPVSAGVITVNTHPALPWYKKLSIRKYAAEFRKTISSFRTEQIDRGVLLHIILANISDETHWQEQFELCSGQYALSAAEKNEFRQILTVMFSLPQMKSWFAPQVKAFAELSIMTGQGEIRPDRVVEADIEVVVIDFKTGRENAAYFKQIAQYRDILGKIYAKPVRGFLAYLDLGRIVAYQE
jgi:ATP-dependent exoDNAse (exonuclease V) beta subunit